MAFSDKSMAVSAWNADEAVLASDRIGSVDFLYLLWTILVIIIDGLLWSRLRYSHKNWCIDGCMSGMTDTIGCLSTFYGIQWLSLRIEQRCSMVALMMIQRWTDGGGGQRAVLFHIDRQKQIGHVCGIDHMFSNHGFFISDLVLTFLHAILRWICDSSNK